MCVIKAKITDVKTENDCIKLCFKTETDEEFEHNIKILKLDKSKVKEILEG